MATQNDNPPQAATPNAGPSSHSGGRVVEFDDYIEAQLRKTRGHVRTVDVAANLMVLAAGTLAFFLVAALFDHWLITGGLGFWGRTLFLAAYVVSALGFLAVRIGPLLLHRINPLYAAHTIERSEPSLKNTLVNFLFFRSDRSAVSPVMYRAIEEQAATNLAGAHADMAVDRSNLVRIGYVLLTIIFVGALYAMLSPKGLFQTVGRIAAPWADISAPTSTTISHIEPGDTDAFRGQQIRIAARVQGLADDEKVTLFYTTADGQIVDRAIEMTLGSDGYKHTATLPAGDGSLQQDLIYRIEAGDAITRAFDVTVVDAPTIFVEALRYEYPKYTGLLAQRVEQQGDIKAIEGTRVTVEGLANSGIDSAFVDFDCDGKLDQRMSTEEQRATASFRLAFDADGKEPKYGSYQLVFTNTEGQRNPQPVQHQIEVTRDIPPEIEIVAPSKEEVALPANGTLTWETVANDPDFALGMVKVSAERSGEPLLDKLVLSETRPGQFVARVPFDASKFTLKTGDVVEYWATAEDNKTPRPNRTQTPRRRIRIVEPDETQSEQDQVAQNDPTGDDGQGERRAGSDSDQPRDEDTPPEDNPDPDQEQQRSQNADGQDGSPRQQDGDQQDQSEQGQGGDDGQQRSDDRQSEDQRGNDAEQGDESSSTGQSGDGQTDASSKGGEGQPSDDEPGVASDGSNDGDAIERILKHRQQQGKSDPADERQRAGEQRQEPSGDQQESDPTGSQDRQSSDNSAGQQDDGGQRQEADNQKQTQVEPAGDESMRKEQPGSDPAERRGGDQQDRQGREPQDGQQREQASPDGQKRDAAQENSAQEDGQKDSDQSDSAEQKGGQQDDAQRNSGQPQEQRQEQSPDDQSTEGQGAQSKSDPTGAQNQPSRSQQRPDTKGGDGQRNKGNSGAGQKSEDQQGSPSPQDSNQPREKSDRESPDSESDSQDANKPQSPSQSKRESDSEGGDEGDRSGGGKRGGGQKANKPGTGGAGQNTAADEGAGTSQQEGQGETSDRGGEDQAADGSTGSSGSKKGAGSEQRGTGDKPGQPNRPSDEQQSEADSPRDDSQADGEGQPGGGTPTGQGGERANDNEPPERPSRSAPEVEDKANLDYARKATDLALSHLKDELAKDQPDPELLESLGWTRDDLQRFVNRWEQLRKQADTPSAEGRDAKRELDDTLRSLGLRPRTTTLRGNDARDDQFKRLRESRRSSPPPEYAEQTKAYTQGTARGGK